MYDLGAEKVSRMMLQSLQFQDPKFWDLQFLIAAPPNWMMSETQAETLMLLFVNG